MPDTRHMIGDVGPHRPAAAQSRLPHRPAAAQFRWPRAAPHRTTTRALAEPDGPGADQIAGPAGLCSTSAAGRIASGPKRPAIRSIADSAACQETGRSPNAS